MVNNLISTWLRDASSQLRNIGIASPRLDSEIILAHTLRKSRTYLHAHLDDILAVHTLEIADARLQLRMDRTPVAYIIGHKEFYGRNFKVTPSTLIPRPESEDIITLLKETSFKDNGILSSRQLHLVDIGTGSGCLGITAKLELPELDVTLTDTSRYALRIARDNARTLNATIETIESNLLAHCGGQIDYILANLPYVDRSWERSPETSHEPAEALFAEEAGLHLIYKLLAQAPAHLNPGGIVLLEADTRQHQSIIERAVSHQLTCREVRGFIIALQYTA